jgi:hypothetical protein
VVSNATNDSIRPANSVFTMGTFSAQSARSFQGTRVSAGRQRRRSNGQERHPHARWRPPPHRELRIGFGLDGKDPRTGAWGRDLRTPTPTPRERELLEGSSTVQPVDFHSTRRAYATTLARIGANEQTAMKLTAHADLKTHQRYQAADQVLTIPEAAVVPLSPEAVAVFAANQNRPKPGTKPETETKKPAGVVRQPVDSTQHLEREKRFEPALGRRMDAERRALAMDLEVT